MLHNLSSLGFGSVYGALSGIRMYHIDPAVLRVLRPSGQSSTLLPEGANVASVLRGLAQSHPELADRIQGYLRAIVPGFERIEIRQIAGLGVPYFKMSSGDGKGSTNFPVTNVSDGTLRALAILVALFQAPAPTLQLLEEPETALHPGATGVLLDAMLEASERSQILVTTHSADLLDQKDIPDESILAVVAEDGTTRIGPLDDSERSAIRDHLFTAGELLRTGGLHLAPGDTPNQRAEPA
jgi:predicted ATPase